ncbi:porin [Paraburkholderia sediminicola]|uniref:porin n=1 Tax=Paraburkholderia sediminicola TaxID=458836 RepID=UPI0038BA77F6
MFRPIFIECGTPFCHAARAQSSVTLYGFPDDAIVYSNCSSPASAVGGPKIFQMASSSESLWGLSGRGDLGGGTRALYQRENGFNSNGGVFGEDSQLFGRQAVVGLSNPHMGKLMMRRVYDFISDYVGPLVFSRQWAGGMGAHAGESNNLYNSSCLTNNATYTTSHINGLVLRGAYTFSSQASSTGRAGFAKDRAYTVGACYQNGPLVTAASYLEVNQSTAGNMGGSNQSGAGAGDYVNLRHIFSGPAVRLQAVAGGSNYRRGSFMAGPVYCPVKLSYACRTWPKLSNYETNSRYPLAAGWRAGVTFFYMDGYADEGNSLHKFAVGTRPKWERVNLGRDNTLSKRISLYEFPAWQKVTWNATRAAIFNSSRLSGRRTAANSVPRLKCAHNSSHRQPLNQRSAEVIGPNNSLGVFGAWDIET